MKPVVLALAFAAVACAQNPLVQAYQARYNAAKQNFIESAEAMPADAYSFKLTPAQRAFGEWIEHTIMLNHGMCSAMKGIATPPMDHSKHSAGKPKADLQAALKESFDYCDSVVKELTDQKVLAEVEIGGKKSVPVASMFSHIANLYSHYGNIVGYMRSKGIVPPSTARTMKK